MQRRPVLLAIFLIGALTSAVPAQPGPPPSSSSPSPSPRLLVIIVVDQMRADYVTAFRADWTAGLRRLIDEGAWFTNAAYPYGGTLTCPGHATVSTGTFPSGHGIVGNSWFDRATGRQIACTDDPAAAPVAYGSSSGGGHSATHLRVPTLGEHLQRLRRARVAAVSIKARSAVMLAGKHADAVTWLADSLDGWQTSTAFASRPLPPVKAFLDANPVGADHGKVWTALQPPLRHREADDGAGETPPRGWTTTFPHVVSGDGRDGRRSRTQWVHSPFADAFLGRFAADLVQRLRLGQSDSTDVLGVSFSTLDSVGHAFGPRSREVRELLARLDQTIGALLSRLDALAGRNAYVVALTSDHGVGELAARHPRQSVEPSRLAALVEASAAAAAGDGRYVAAVTAEGVYFRPGMYEKLAAAPRGIDGIVTALGGDPGVASAFSRDQIAGRDRSDDPTARAAALGSASGRSGDFVFILRAGYELSSGPALAANHGTFSDEDRRVPVLLAGPRIRPGRYDEAITPADIAPTLAALAGVALPGVQGRVLTSALLTPAPASLPSSLPSR